MTATDALDAQNNEFDALTALAKQWHILQRVAVVDDDYPACRHKYEATLRDFLRALRENGRLEAVEARAIAAEQERDRLLAILNTPQLDPFAEAVVAEAKHQVHRWGEEHDAGKSPWDWYWTLGYLGGKAGASHAAGDHDKALHHTVTGAALLAHWHRALIATRDGSARTRGDEMPA